MNFKSYNSYFMLIIMLILLSFAGSSIINSIIFNHTPEKSLVNMATLLIFMPVYLSYLFIYVLRHINTYMDENKNEDKEEKGDKNEPKFG